MPAPLLVVCAFLLLSLSASARPNFLIVIGDDLCWRDLGATGNPDVRDFYTDVQHIRVGLPRYTVAALMFACLFEESPTKLDWKLYNDRPKYGPDPAHDAGELLEITPDRAKLVHETIDALLATHPHVRQR